MIFDCIKEMDIELSVDKVELCRQLQNRWKQEINPFHLYSLQLLISTPLLLHQ